MNAPENIDGPTFPEEGAGFTLVCDTCGERCQSSEAHHCPGAEEAEAEPEEPAMFTLAEQGAVARLIDGEPEEGDPAIAAAALAKMRAPAGRIGQPWRIFLRDRLASAVEEARAEGLNDAVIRAAAELLASSSGTSANPAICPELSPEIQPEIPA